MYNMNKQLILILILFASSLGLTAEGSTNVTLLNLPDIPSIQRETDFAFLVDSGYLNRRIPSMDSSLQAASVSPVFVFWKEDNGFSCSFPVNYSFADTKDYGLLKGYSFSQQFNMSKRITGSKGENSLFLSYGVMNTFTSLYYDVQMINNSKTVNITFDKLSFSAGFSGKWFLSEKSSIQPFYNFRLTTDFRSGFLNLMNFSSKSDYIFSTSNNQEISQKNEFSHLLGVSIDLNKFLIEACFEIRHEDGFSIIINSCIPITSR